MGKLAAALLVLMALALPAIAQNQFTTLPIPTIPVSQLPAAGTLTGPELFYAVQGGVSKSVTFSGLVQSISTALFTTTVPITGGSFSTLNLTSPPANGEWLSNFGPSIQNCPLTENCSVIGTHQYTAEYFKFTATQNATISEYGLTLDANLNSGLSPNWVAATAYVSGNFVVNGANVYLETVASCTSAGSGGPTGTGSGIVDNTCSWNYAGPSFNAAKAGFYFSAVSGPQSAPTLWDGAMNMVIGVGTPSQFIQTLEIDQTNNSGIDPTVASGKGFFDLNLTGDVGSKPITAYLNLAQGGGAGPNFAAHYGAIIQAPFTADTVGLELSDYAPVSLCMGCLWAHAIHATAAIYDNTNSSVAHHFAGTYITAGILFDPGVIQSGGTAITLGQQAATGTGSPSQILSLSYWNSGSAAANVTLRADGAGQLILGGSSGVTNLVMPGELNFTNAVAFVAPTNCGSLASSTKCLAVIDPNGNTMYAPLYGTY